MVRSKQVVARDIVIPTAPGPAFKAAFGKRLHDLLERRHMRKSELARLGGFERAAVGTWVHGRSFPHKENFDKLCEVLRVPPEDLLPDMAEESPSSVGLPTFEVRSSPSSPDRVWLRINRLVSMATAAKVTDILDADPTMGEAVAQRRKETAKRRALYRRRRAAELAEEDD